MAKIYYGCDEITKGWPRYFGLCNSFEVLHSDPPPSIQTLNTWRVESPKGFAFVMHAVPEVAKALVALADAGATVIDDRLRAAWKETELRANALAAKAIVIPTPFEFMPSTAARSLIASLGDELASKSKRIVVWESQGVWPVEETLNLCTAHGISYLVDPFLTHEEEIDLGTQDIVVRLTERGGMRRNFDQFDFEELVERLGRHDRVFALMRGQYKWRHARELKQVLSEIG